MGALRIPLPPMRRAPYCLELLAFLAISTAAWGDDAGMRRCRAIAEAPARLACYDALPLATQPGPGASPAPVRATPPAPTPRAHASPEAQFGLAQPPAEELPAIESHVPGLFPGWRPNERIGLANGQVWQVVDESSSLLQRSNPKVTVRRGALGAFYLDIEGDNRSPRVRRVQ
jgi:hypothetical protein